MWGLASRFPLQNEQALVDSRYRQRNRDPHIHLRIKVAVSVDVDEDFSRDRRAFEMLFKAYLLEHGETVKLLQSMDSDLERIRRRVMDIGRVQLVVFQGLEETAIDLLVHQLVNRELAFQPFAASSPPPYFLLRAAAGRLAPVVRQEIADREAERGGQPRLVASSL